MFNDLPILKLELSVNLVVNSSPRSGKVISRFPMSLSLLLIRLNISKRDLKVFGL